MALSHDELEHEEAEYLPERQMMTSFTLPTVSTTNTPEGGGPLGPVGQLKDGLLGGLGKGGQGGGLPTDSLPTGSLTHSLLGGKGLVRHLAK